MKKKKSCFSVAGVQTGDTPCPSTMAWSGGSALQEFFNFLLLNNSAFVRAGGQHPPPCAFLISSIHSTDAVSLQSKLSDKVHMCLCVSVRTWLHSSCITEGLIADLLNHQEPSNCLGLSSLSTKKGQWKCFTKQRAHQYHKKSFTKPFFSLPWLSHSFLGLTESPAVWGVDLLVTALSIWSSCYLQLCFVKDTDFQTTIYILEKAVLHTFCTSKTSFITYFNHVLAPL